MDISKFGDSEGVVSKEKYDELYNEYNAKCEGIIPLNEKYVLNKAGTISGIEFAEGTTFVLTLAYTPNIARIDLLIMSEAYPCIVFNDIDELLSVLKTLDFSVYKKEVIEKLAFLKEETIKLFKMMQANDVELLLDVKGVFRKLGEHAENANYSVKIQDR